MTHPYRAPPPGPATRKLRLGIITRLAHALGATYDWHLVDMGGAKPVRLLGTNEGRTAIAFLSETLRAYGGPEPPDIRLWDYAKGWEYRLSVETCAQLLNECRICGARYQEPCDAGLHS